MKYLAAIILLAFASCAPKAIVVEPIAPRAVRVADAAKATAKAAEKVSETAAFIRRHNDKARAEIIEGMLAAEAMRKAGLATPEQLDANAGNWQKAYQRNLFLEASAQALTIDATELREAAERGKVEADQLEVEAVKTDKSTADLKTEIVKQSDNAALGKNIKRAGWIILGTLILAAGLFGALKILAIVKPL